MGSKRFKMRKVFYEKETNITEAVKHGSILSLSVYRRFAVENFFLRHFRLISM